MTNAARSCCCSDAPAVCSCAPESGTNAYRPLFNTGQFIYEVDFPGYAGRVQLNRTVSGVEVRTAGLPGNKDPNAGPTGGQYCIRAYPPGGDCAPYLAYSIASAYISIYDREETTTDCGFDLDQYSAVFIAAVIIPAPNTCGSDGGQCYPSYYDDGDSVLPGFITDTGSPTAAALWLVNAVGVMPGLRVEEPYSTAGTIRFTWNGGITESFTASLTSSTNGPTGSPTILTNGCYYLHRARSNTACANSSGATAINVCTYRPLLGNLPSGFPVSGDGPGSCQSDSCCCETEIAIQFRVWQTTYKRGYVGLGTFGDIAGPSHESNTVTAYYRGCHDGRLYSATSTEPATRTMKLDRVAFQLADLPASGKGWSKLGPINPVNNRINANYGNGVLGLAGAAPVESTSVVVDSRSCGCTTGITGETVMTAARAIEIGVPETIVVRRVSP